MDAAGATPSLHDRPTQRAHALHQKKAEPARALQRQKIRKQTAVEEIDRQSAAGHVGAAHMLISSRPVRRRRRRVRWAATTSSPMVAASRKPRLRPCAPIGGMTCAASPISDHAPGAQTRRGLDRQLEDTATGLDRDLAQDRMRAALDLGRHFRVRKRREARGVGGINYEHQARSLSGQRHQRERARLGVKFGRRVVMGTAMAEVEGERGLAVGSAVESRCRQRRGITNGAPQRRSRGASIPRSPLHLMITPSSSISTAVASSSMRVSAAKRVGARCKRGGEKPVLDVAAEGVEPDLACSKSNFGRPQQPRGIIDDPQDAQRRGMFAALVPDAERVERAYRACEKRGGAVIWRRAALGDQRGFDTGRRERDRRGQARRASADDGHFGGQISHLPLVLLEHRPDRRRREQIPVISSNLTHL